MGLKALAKEDVQGSRGALQSELQVGNPISLFVERSFLRNPEGAVEVT